MAVINRKEVTSSTSAANIADRSINITTSFLGLFPTLFRIFSSSPFSLRYLSRSMTQSSVEPDKSATGLDNATYNLISALEREADFLYSTVETYINDARKESRPQAEEIWKTMKDDKRKHIRMLREALSKEAISDTSQQ